MIPSAPQFLPSGAGGFYEETNDYQSMNPRQQEIPRTFSPGNTAERRQIAIRLHDGSRIVIRAEGQETVIPFLGMAQLLCVKEDAVTDESADVELIKPDRMPEKRYTQRSTSLTDIAYAKDWNQVLIAGWKREPRTPVYYRNYVWQATLIFACLNSILHGGKALLVHCATLETDRGAVLLFGESGMGKSTASTRWRAYGGKCVSDDMALLDFSGEETVYVRRMPTWSVCREGRNEWNYPSREEIPLAGVLALGRSKSGHDEIVPISRAQYFAQCYRSMFYWFVFAAAALPDVMKERLASRVRMYTEIITGKFPPRALLSALEGNITEIIKEQT